MSLLFCIAASLTAPEVAITETTIGSATVTWGDIGSEADKFVVHLAPTGGINPNKAVVSSATHMLANYNMLRQLYIYNYKNLIYNSL